MNKIDREELDSNNSCYQVFDRIKALFFAFILHPIWFVAFVFCMCSAYVGIEYLFDLLVSEISFIQMLKKVSIVSILIVVLIILIWLFSGGVSALLLKHKFLRIGLTNSANETPIFLWMNKKNGSVLEYVFDSRGITLEIWQDRILEIENILNISVIKISIGKKASEIHLFACKGKFDYELQIEWMDNLLSSDSSLCIGKSVQLPIYLDLNKTAHILIGGATGSGKTWLLKHLLLQCIKKEYQVVIADYKGGIDYPLIWKSRCEFATSDECVLDILNKLVDELNVRREKFLESGASNIEEYSENMKHIIFACDELAEMLDVTGLSKDEKEMKKKIERHISTIARLGRAFGIHLILATQRPDADVLNGQIKNNLTYRICGRSDDVLSKIILDNTDAANRVPKDAQGVFLNHEGILFKGYCFEEENMKGDSDGE